MILKDKYHGRLKNGKEGREHDSWRSQKCLSACHFLSGDNTQARDWFPCFLFASPQFSGCGCDGNQSIAPVLCVDRILRQRLDCEVRPTGLWCWRLSTYAFNYLECAPAPTSSTTHHPPIVMRKLHWTTLWVDPKLQPQQWST